MPETGYSLKPTPEMRSFAEQMLHLTDANYGFASSATGEKSPVGRGESEKTTDQSKANVTKLVMAGYDFVINGVKKMTPRPCSLAARTASQPSTIFTRLTPRGESSLSG